MKGRVNCLMSLWNWLQSKWMWLVDLNYNFECNWPIELSNNKLSDDELSDNKLSDDKLSDNNLASELMENRSFWSQSQSWKL